MLRRIFSLVIVVVTLAIMGSFGANAQTYSLSGDIEIALPDDFTLLTSDNLKTNEATLEELGHSISSLHKYMDEKHIIFIALDEGNENQVQLGAFQTEFSKDVQDLGGLKAEELQRVGNQMLGGNFEIISINGWIYFKTKLDGLAGYGTIQYITFKNGMLYTLSYYGSDGEMANTIAAGLTLPEKKSQLNTKTVLISILLWVALVIALVTMVLLSLSLISELRKSREDNDVREYIRIKRRRL